MILWIRLAFATAVILAPGVLVARALGRRGIAAAFAWSVAVVAGALALTFAVHGSLWLTLGLVLGAGAVAVPFARRSARGDRLPGAGVVTLAGLALGGALWFIEGVLHGDALFHLGRVRKLDDFGSLSLRAVDEFKDGGLHPGYAFPLWHGWLALVAKVAGVDPSSVVLHEPSLLAPLALLLAYEAGRTVFGSVTLGFAAMVAQVGLIAFAPGDGGAYTTLDGPGTVARQLLVPAAIALFFVFARAPSWQAGVTLAALGMDLAFVHPTYALFLAIPLVGYVVVRARQDLVPNVLALAAYGLPALLVFAWLKPIVDETQSHNPSPAEKASQLRHYAHDLVVHSQSSYHLAAGMVSRSGAIAIAALVLVPLAGLAGRRRWSALVLGGTVIVLGLELWDVLFPHFSDAVSLSQSRRAAGFVPFAFALAGGAAVLTRFIGPAVVPVALAAGIVLQLEYPGDFGTTFHASPAAPAWIALFGGIAGLVVYAVRRGSAREGPVAAFAVVLFTIPVLVHGFSHWHTSYGKDPSALTPGLVRFLRTDVPKRSVVFADLETSYRISAYAPVYVCNAPPAHVADTRANRPAARRADVIRFLRTGSLAIARRYDAQWLVLRRGEPVARAEAQGARPVYRDASFIVFKL
ncbi:MAG TPA: hypothetical protein VKR23_11675 [Gaiellaceae bacterium]|nr:hypothetical protein [Gaiellaceae bacterium]